MSTGEEGWLTGRMAAERLEALADDLAGGRPVLASRIRALRDAVVVHGDEAGVIDELELVARFGLGGGSLDDAVRRFRYELNLAASDRGVDLALVRRGDAGDPPGAWLADRVDLDVLSREANALPEANRPSVPTMAVLDAPPRPPLAVGEDGVVRVLVLAADADRAKAQDLVDRLAALVRASVLPPGITVEWAISPEVGDQPEAWWAREAARCSAALALVSPKLLDPAADSSARAMRLLEELVEDRPIVPIVLHPVGGRPNLGPLGRFAGDGFLPPLGVDPSDAADRAYGEQRSPADRDRFARRIADRLVTWVDTDAGGRRVGPELPRWTPDQERVVALRAEHRLMQKRATEERGHGRGEDVQVFLDRWVRNPSGTPYLALLGEYGMGKTVSSQTFARRLLDARDADPDLPRPFYFDLRDLRTTKRDKVWRLEEILSTLTDRMWHSGGVGAIATDPASVVAAVQRGGAVAIFDGLDEVLVHLDSEPGRVFLRELLKVLPPSVVDADPPGGRVGRVLLTCRTHYFRTVGEEHSYFFGEDRDGLRRDRHGQDRYSALYLLPFTDEQVRAFLELRLGDAVTPVSAVYAYIQEVHNLADLAQRPYTLELIVGILGRLEEAVAAGDVLDAASLYGRVVEEWLDRDAGKHTFEEQHKLRLMEDLAAELVRRGERQVGVDELDVWLQRQVAGDGPIAEWYRTVQEPGRGPDLLRMVAEDLRTATFIVRPGQDSFQFAHSSMQEYFLARYLLRCLVEGELDGWALESVSTETLSFLGQMMAASGRGDDALAGLREIRARYRPSASELAFSYCLRAALEDHPTPGCRGFQLAGADLRGLEVPSSGRAIDLSDTVLRSADLRHARLADLRLRRADLRDVDLSWAEVYGGVLSDVDLAGATLVATTFRHVSLRSVDARGADVHDTALLHCEEVECLWPEGGDRPAVVHRAPRATPEARPPDARPIAVATPAIQCLDVGDDGLTVTGGREGVVRLWDGRSGRPLWESSETFGYVWRVGRTAIGDVVVAASSTLALLDRATGDVRASRSLPYVQFGRVTDDDRFAVARSGLVLVYDLDEGSLAHELDPHDALPVGDLPAVVAFDWAPDARLLAVDERGGVWLIEPVTGEVSWHVPPVDGVRGYRTPEVGCSASGLVAVARDGRVAVYDVRTGDLEWDGAVEGEGSVYALDWASDDRLAVAGNTGVQIRDGRTGDEIWRWHGARGWVAGAGWTADGALVVGDSTGSVRKLDGADGATCWSSVSLSSVQALAPAPGGRIGIGDESGVRTCDPETGRLSTLLSVGDIRFFRWSSDAELVTNEWTGRMEVAGEEGASIGSYLLALGPNGMAATYPDSDLEVRQVLSGELVWAQPVDGCEAMAWSPDGQLLATMERESSKRRVILRHGTTGAVVWRSGADDAPGGALAWADDRTLIATTDEGDLLPIRRGGHPERWRRLRRIPATAYSLGLAAQGTRVAWGDGDGVVVTDLARSEPLWNRPTGMVRSLIWGSGGHLAVAHIDRSTTSVLEGETGALLATIESLGDGEAIVSGPDGSLLDATPDAWRSARFQVPRPDGSGVDVVPLETYPPVPQPPAT